MPRLRSARARRQGNGAAQPAHQDLQQDTPPVNGHVPAHAGITEDCKPLVYRTGQHGRQRVVRMVYEVVTFQALREHLRCKEIWITGADRWRNPDEDLPADFEARRDEHYASLRKPLDPAAFITELREEMRAELDALHDALPRLDWLQIAERREGAIKLTPLDAAPEPRNLRLLKKEIAARWGTVPLIDMFKEAVLRTGCLAAATSAATRGDLDPGVLAQRLLLAIYAYGTNTGVRAVAAGEPINRYSVAVGPAPRSPSQGSSATCAKSRVVSCVSCRLVSSRLARADATIRSSSLAVMLHLFPLRYQ